MTVLHNAPPPSHAPRQETPLLFVHGAWHGAWCWQEYFLPYFVSQGFEVYALDLRGHGSRAATDAGLRWFSAADFVEDVAAVAQSCPRPPVLIGHSMGGYVVQKYLEKYPAPAVVLLAPVPPAGVLRTTLSIALRFPIEFLKVLLTLRLYPLVSAPASTREHFFSEEIAQTTLARYHEKIGDESFRAFLDMLLLNLPRPRRVPSVPMLVLGARNDTIFTPAEVQATARAYDAELTIFPDMAHDMMLEPGWQTVADCVIAWIKAQPRDTQER